MLSCIENSRLKLELDHQEKSLKIYDLSSGEVFQSSKLLELYYGKFYKYNLAEHTNMSIKSDATSITLRFEDISFWARFKGNGYVKPINGPDLKIELTIALAENRIDFKLAEVENLGEEDITLAICPDLCVWSSKEEAEFLLPFGYGLLYSFPRQDSFHREIHPGWGYSFPLYALFMRNKATLVYYMKTPLDLQTNIDFNMAKKDSGVVTTEFCFNKTLTNYAREMQLYIMPKESTFVQVAKLYRQIVKDEQRFVSLKEKIEANPEVEKLIGSVIWKHNVYCKTPPEGVEKGYSLYMPKPNFNSIEQLPNNWQAHEIYDLAKERGFDRVCVYNTGWQRNGYDSSYPTRFPVNEERGSEEDFSAASDYARSLSPDYIFSVHDNYFDTYDDTLDDCQEELIRTKDQAIMNGGIWQGGRAKFICSHCSMKYVKRDIPRIAKIFGKGSIYLDVMGNAPPELCFHPEHPQGHREDVQSRRDILKFIKSYMGSIATEGVPSDYYVDLVDVGAFAPIHDTDLHAHNAPRPVPVPFWQLVYHDAVLNYTSEGIYGFHGSEYKLLVALYCLLPTQFDDFSKIISFDLREAFTAEMVDFEFLDVPSVDLAEDGGYVSSGVAKSTFSNGTIVVANFNVTPYFYNGVEIAPRDFIIKR